MTDTNMIAIKALYKDGRMQFDSAIFKDIQEAEIIITIIPKVLREKSEENLILSQAYNSIEDEDVEEDRIWSSYLK